MNTALINVVKILFTFESGETAVIPYFTTVHNTPINMLDLIWNTNRFKLEGKVAQIQIVDGTAVFDVDIPDNLELKNNFRIQISYPNNRFMRTAKKTNIVNISFCMDKLPRNIDHFVDDLIEGIDYAHHPHINFVHEGYYGEGVE